MRAPIRRLGPLAIAALLAGMTGLTPTNAAAPNRHLAPPARALVHRRFIQQAQGLTGTRSARQTPATAAAGTPLGPGPWTALGPQPINGLLSYGPVSGRVTALDANTGSTVYAGTADGGVWKSSDGGNHWSTTTDTQLPTLAIGALAVDWTTVPETVYAGTGEGNLCQDCLPSQGVAKSVDGGVTWSSAVSLSTGRYAINALVIDASSLNHARVLAAASNGLYQSLNGGTSWTLLQAGDFNTLSQNPSVPAQFWATQTTSCSGAPGPGAIGYWSTASNAWQQLWPYPNGPSMPNSIRIGLGVGGVAPNVTAYAAFATCPDGALGGLLKTNDGGATWTVIPPSSSLPDYFSLNAVPAVSQGWYDNVVAVDPNDPSGNTAVFGGITMLSTFDGGASFTDVARPYNGGPVHPDFHAFAFVAADTLYAGNDGGVWSTTNLGGTGLPSDWANLNGPLSITQFYSGSALDLSHLVGGSQDNGVAGIIPQGPPAPAWASLLDGDGTGATMIPGSTTVFTANPQLDIYRVDDSNGANTEVAPCSAPYNPNTNPICADPVSFVAPFVQDPTTTSPANARLYGGTNRVYTATNAGTAGTGLVNWRAISSDLTFGPAAGNRTTPDVISAMAIGAGSSQGTLLTGSWYGKVWITANAPAASANSGWTDISAGLPLYDPTQATGNPWVTGLGVNPLNRSELWVTIGTQTGSRVWHTVNAGANPTTWSDISATLPASLVVDSITVDPIKPQNVYIGTDAGALACATCGGSLTITPSWVPLGTGGLPNVRVDAITLTTNDINLVAWTHGRGAFSLPRPYPTPGATLNPTAWDFGSKSLAESSPSQNFTLTNDGTAPLNVSSITTSGDFAVVARNGPCLGAAPYVLAPGDVCTIWLTFTPSQLGHRTGALTVNDDAANSPQTASLSGNGLSQWQSLGGNLTTGPASSSSAANETDVFVRGGDNAVWHRTFNGTGWSGWTSLGGAITADPAAVASSGRIELFARGTDGALWQRTFNGTSWSPWMGLGGLLNSAPTASSNGANELDVFALGTDNALWHRQWTNGNWSAWESLGGLSNADPAAVSPLAGVTEVLVRGLDNALWFRDLRDSGWTPLGGRLNSGPTATSWGGGRVDVFALGTDNALWHKFFPRLGSWSSWASAGGLSNADPSAVARSQGVIDLFVRGTDMALWYKVVDGS